VTGPSPIAALIGRGRSLLLTILMVTLVNVVLINSSEFSDLPGVLPISKRRLREKLVNWSKLGWLVSGEVVG